MAIVFQHDNILDAALDYIALADQLVMCENIPASYAEATTDKGSGGKALGETAIGSGDFTNAAGDTSGRKTTLAQQSGITVDVTGTIDCVALVDDGDSLLLIVAPLANAAITGVDIGNDIITISGDHTSVIVAGDTVTVRDSTGNDGVWTVASAVLNSSGNTDVTMNEDVTDATVDGIMIYGAKAVTASDSVTINAFDMELHDLTVE